MQFSTTVAALAAMASLAAAQSASIYSFSASDCSSGFQGAFDIPSNSGECYAETSSQGIIVNSVDPGCSVTVYCDSACSTCANIANVGDCRTGVSGYSVDC